MLSKASVYLIALLIGVGSFFLSSWNNGFSNNFHTDEYKKIEFIKGKTPDFHHPLLLIRSGMLMQSVFPDIPTVVAGRLVSAAAVGVSSVIIFFILQSFFGSKVGLFGAIVFGVVPIVTIHGHYLKEDILQTMTLILFMFSAQGRIKEKSNKVYFVLMALALGLAFSTHYKSILLLIILPLFYRDLALNFKSGFLMLAIASSVFVLINFAFEEGYFLIFSSGVGNQSSHSIGGHTVDFYPVPYLFLFHAINSLIMGMGILPALIGFAGLFLMMKFFRELDPRYRLWLVYFFLFYLAIELSPTKPHPDYSRYALPCVPALLVFMGYAIDRSKLMRPVWYYGLGLLIIAVPLTDSMMIIKNIKHDTRLQAQQLLNEGLATNDLQMSDVLVFSLSATGRRETKYLSTFDIDELVDQGYDYILVTNFWYERFFNGSSLNLHASNVYQNAAFFRQLFDEYPFQEIRPTYRSYAFSNPIVRIVDIRKPKD